jgi:hypothetical protein
MQMQGVVFMGIKGIREQSSWRENTKYRWFNILK